MASSKPAPLGNRREWLTSDASARSWPMRRVSFAMVDFAVKNGIEREFVHKMENLENPAQKRGKAHR
jgi:hypothetical protein